MTLNLQAWLPKTVPITSKFEMKNWFIWGSTMVRTDDGVYHLIFSRWRKEFGFDSWAIHSELAYATSNDRMGPFTYNGVALSGSGDGKWDGDNIHNEALLLADGKYYLYYGGNYGNGEFWDHRNHQRVGVAVADHPSGPWKRFEKPLIEPKDGNWLTTTPTITARPEGGYLMVYKTVTHGSAPFGGSVKHIIATSDHPLGPFKDHPEPFIRSPRTNFPIDDHYEFYYQDRYYCIAKDHGDNATPHGNALILYDSNNGFNWGMSEHTLVMPRWIHWEDGTVQHFRRLEMPKLLFNDEGDPTVLLLAALTEDEQHSFCVAIPLTKPK